MVIVFECKNTTRTVEVSEIEEFNIKIDSHALGFRIKGYVITRRGFQKGSINMAKKLGTGLIRFIPDEQVDFISFFGTMDSFQEEMKGFRARARRALHEPDYQSINEDVFCFDAGYAFANVAQMVVSAL